MGSGKSQILKMVEDGIISVDDAVKLLEAVRHVNGYHRHWLKPDFDSKTFDDKIGKFSRQVESFAKDVKDRVSDTW
jgi:hypothetical protein